MHDMAWRCDVNYVRSKDAHNQWAWMSLKTYAPINSKLQHPPPPQAYPGHLQGGNKVCFFIADPIFVQTNFWSLIPKAWPIFVPDPTNMVQPDPWSLKHCWSRSHGLWSLTQWLWSQIPPFSSQIQSLWSLIPHTSLRPWIWLCIVPGEGGIWMLSWKGGEFKPDLSLVLT